jgi:hypothetical protein
MAVEQFDISEYAQHGDDVLRGIRYWAEQTRELGMPIASMSAYEQHVAHLRALPLGGVEADLDIRAAEMTSSTELVDATAPRMNVAQALARLLGTLM